MRDLQDRIAEVQIDVVDPDLLDALDTSPRARRFGRADLGVAAEAS